MKTEIKICGISTAETLDCAIQNGASHIGFMFFEKSPRHLNFDTAAKLGAQAQSRANKVGVFVNADDAYIEQAISAARLDILQLHGDEAPERAKHLTERFSIECWKVISVKTKSDLALANNYQGSVARILYDAKTPKTADLPGGMGVRFDWEMLRGFNHNIDWALAGGLNSDNVGTAIASTGAPLVDVSSGVESAPGIKNLDKIIRFCQAVEQL